MRKEARHRVEALNLGLANVFGLEVHGAKTIDLTGDIVAITGILQTDVFYFGADLDRRGRTFDFKIFDDRDGIAILQNISIGVANRVIFDNLDTDGRLCELAPFVSTFRANPKIAIGIDVGGLTLGTGGILIFTHGNLVSPSFSHARPRTGNFNFAKNQTQAGPVLAVGVADGTTRADGRLMRWQIR